MLAVFLAAGMAISMVPPQTDPAKAMAVLRSDAPASEKALACKSLAIYGNKDAVPLLAPLLADEQLASWARIALEAIPDPACDTALRDALTKLKGKLLVGVINSIGVRRDSKAISLLAAKLKDPDPEVASAAAVALGQIGGRTVAATLTPWLTRAPVAVRPAIAEGCIRCAERFLAEKKLSEAAKLYDAVRRANISRQKTLEATRGAILARGPAGVAILAEHLRSEERAFFNIALHTAREIPGRDVAKLLLAELKRAPGDRQPALLLTLADRRDPETLSAALDAAQSGPVELRLTAVQVLERLCDPSSAAVLLNIAVQDDAALAQAAKSAVVKLPGQSVDKAIVALLGQSSVAARRTGIELIGARNMRSAVPALLQAAEDPPVAAASLKVLGDLAELDHVPALLALLAKAKQTGPFEAALTSVFARQTDRGRCAELVLSDLPKAQGAHKLALLRLLRSAGGPRALAAIRSAAQDTDPETRETALRTLCDWPTPDALPDLVALSQTATDLKWRILALRGQLRLIPKQDAPATKKLAALKELQPLIERAEEKRLLLAALGEIHDGESLALIAPYLKTELKEEAAVAAVAVAEKIIEKNPKAVAEGLREVPGATSDKKLANRARQLLQQAKKK
ncbi:MAG: HEAT repeat domain-containing protein [Verrucomicrobiae bacterium]|nr:HEAT repeat domain-containing protein [Verrucomicrobiae bacterium]